MNYLFVLDQYGAENNGVSVSARRYAAVLRARGHGVRILSTGDCGPDGYSVPELRIPVFDKLIKSHGMVFGKPEKRVLEQALAWADHVHFLMPFTLSIVTAHRARKMGKPATAAFHVQPQNISYSIGMGRWTPTNAFIYWLFRTDFYGRFRYIHCPSAFIAKQLKAHGYGAECRVISNGITPEFTFRRDGKEAKWRGRFLILMIGRLSGEKRQDVLIEAVKRSRHAQDIQLIFAGQGPLHDAYAKQARGLAHPLQMRFLSQEELRSVIAQCDLYVHTADAEIEAMSCMEAFACGRVPVIANSPFSATPQFALDERSLFCPGDASDLAEKIDYWIEHPDERLAMERAYSESAKKYAIENCVTQFEQLAAEAKEKGSWA